MTPLSHLVPRILLPLLYALCPLHPVDAICWNSLELLFTGIYKTVFIQNLENTENWKEIPHCTSPQGLTDMFTITNRLNFDNRGKQSKVIASYSSQKKKTIKDCFQSCLPVRVPCLQRYVAFCSSLFSSGSAPTQCYFLPLYRLKLTTCKHQSTVNTTKKK